MTSMMRSATLLGLVGLSAWLVAAPADADAEVEVVDVNEASQTPAGTGNLDESTCSFRGTRLAGKVKVVDSFPDVRVKAVSSFPDIKVKEVDAFADDCGEWQFVDSFPDFTIQYVDSFPDFEIAWVESFPGIP